MIGPTKLCPDGIELVLIDLDDTVLADGLLVSPRVLDALTQGRERGCMMGISSGRPQAMVPAVFQGPDAMDYHICANGAVVYDTIKGVLLDRPMPRKQVLNLMDVLAPLHPGWNAFIGDEVYFEWRNFTYMALGRTPTMSQLRDSRKTLHTGMGRYVKKAMRFAKRFLTNREGRHQVFSVRPAIEAATSGVHKVGCSFSSSRACDRAISIIDHLGGFQVARMGRQELEITAEGVTKGTAAEWLMDYLGIPASRVVAFGDSENDVPLAEPCGTFVVVANGDEHVKELADDVCESVYDSGVARWLERAMAEADGVRHV